MVYNGFEYQKEKTYNKDKNYWRCTKGRRNCKARLITFGKCLKVQNDTHNHSRTFKRKIDKLKLVTAKILQ